MSFIIKNVEYTMFKKDNNLIIFAVNFLTLIEYKYIITKEIINIGFG